MEKAIVTGASSGIGAATASALLKSGYEVYGIGRDFAGQSELLEAPLFHERICDLKKHADVKKEIEAIRSEAGQISILVNCAGVGYFGPHEQVNPDKIHEMVAVNIEAPMIIAGLLLRDMKKKRRNHHKYFLRHGKEVKYIRMCLWCNEGGTHKLWRESV